LSPTPAGYTAFRSYENDFRYMCVKVKDPADGVGKYFCGKGTLGDGLTGYAIKQGTHSPRPFWMASLTWGPNTFSRHFALDNILLPISERIPPASQVGYAYNDAWGQNPNDQHADGRTKVYDYIAALGLKTATNRSGVYVSPYNHNNATGNT